jgi:hypothetical protein
VQAVGQQSEWAPDGAPLHYEHHRPEQTALYRLVQQHAASFIAHTEAKTSATGRNSPAPSRMNRKETPQIAASDSNSAS